jgi:protein-disulfide isomerase
MASRAEQKAQARAQRIEFERQQAESAQRKDRLMRLAGVGLVGVIVVIAAIVISAGNKAPAPVKPGSTASNAITAQVSTLLKGIPESGTTLGSPTAPVTINFYGDLECSACDYFAVPTNRQTSAGIAGSGVEDQLINTYVRTGEVRLIYRSMDTATGGSATSGVFPTQQVAAEAAGLQQKAWYYIELFYLEQGPEGSGYVTESYLDGLAKQVPGLNYNQWVSDRNDPNLKTQVSTDAAAVSRLNLTYTPSLVVSGPKGRATPIQNAPSWSQVQSAIKLVGG